MILLFDWDAKVKTSFLSDLFIYTQDACFKPMFDMRQHMLISVSAYVFMVPFINVPNDTNLLNDS